MKITKKILENLIREELQALINEGNDPRGFASMSKPVYKTKQEADAALAAAVAAGSEDTPTTDIGTHHQYIAILQKKVKALETLAKKLDPSYESPGETQ